MILTASDVSSLSTALDRWEWAEYIAEAFVVVGCIGELVADIGEKWLGERRSKHIERWSTIVLILALLVSLTTLVRTNELSGFVIGSLGEKAEQADAKAQTALGDSADASAEAGRAKTVADGAEAKAKAASGEAVDAANAAGLAEASAEEAKNRVIEVAEYANSIAVSVNPRMLDRNRFLDFLAGKPKGTAEVWYEPDDLEVSMYARQIADFLGPSGAGWGVTPAQVLPRKDFPETSNERFSLVDKLRMEASGLRGLAIAGGKPLAQKTQLATICGWRSVEPHLQLKD